MSPIKTKNYKNYQSRLNTVLIKPKKEKGITSPL